MTGEKTKRRRPVLLVLASTYPRWAGDPEPGFVHELARRLIGQFRVIVLCPHAPEAKAGELLDGVEVIRYRYAPERWETLVNEGGIVANLRRSAWKYLLVPGFVLAQAWVAWRVMRREKVDIVHAHWLVPQGLIAAALQWLPGKRVPFLVTSHGADLFALKGRLMDRLRRFVLARAEAATVVSSAMRERLGQLDIDLAKVSVLPMGVDLVGRFTPDTSIERSKREILFVGRLVEKKGLRHLLDALPVVLRQLPEVRLRIAGFGPEEAALKRQVEMLGLSGYVEFLGAVPQSELPDLYRRASVFVAPFVEAGSGDQEGLGLVLVEAAGCECPILVGDVPAVWDVIGDTSRFVVMPKQIDAFAQSIIGVLGFSERARTEAGALRGRLVERFDWQSVAKSYEVILSGYATSPQPECNEVASD